MAFHLGKPIFVMLVVAATCGIVILLRPRAGARADLVVWVFSDPHRATYAGPSPAGGPSLVDDFRQRTGASVDVQLLFGRAQNVRLVSMFMAAMRGPTVPDLVEVEIGQVGKFFRPPIDDVGFLPLNKFLEQSGAREIPSIESPGRQGWNARLTTDGAIYSHDGARWALNPNRTNPDMWIDRILPTRFTPWTKKGVIFGVPHDVHPVGIAYRHDLFLDAGIDLLAESSAPGRPLTWARFQDLCLQFKRHWAAKGHRDRHPVELHAGNADDLLMILLQRGLNPIDASDRILMTDPKFAQTVAFYAQLVAGQRRIGAESGSTEAAIAQDLNNGNIAAFMTPDWRVQYIKDRTAVDPRTGRKTLEGAMRLIPLPVFEPGDAPTASWGGTMIAIPRACPRPELAWKLIEQFYLSPPGLEARIAQTKILPPVMEQWDHPAYDHGDPFFGGQKIDRIFIELARQVPPRYVTPASNVASGELVYVLYRAIDHVKRHGNAGLEEACRAWLKDASADLARRIARGTFE